MKKSLTIATLVLLLMACATVSVSAATLEVRNHTAFIVSVFVDGIYVGTIAPFSWSTMVLPYGSHTLYAKAPYTSITWGPTDIYDTGYFTWNLDD